MWYHFIEFYDWFGDFRKRIKIISDFNKASEKAWETGKAPYLLKARFTGGEKANKHANSSFLGSGFAIRAFTLNPLPANELKEIGRIIVDNQELVRRLVSLGWDTLYIDDSKGENGCVWALKDYANFGGFLQQKNEDNE